MVMASIILANLDINMTYSMLGSLGVVVAHSHDGASVAFSTLALVTLGPNELL